MSGPAQLAPWQVLNFLPLPQGHGALRGVLSQSDFTTGCWTTSSSGTGGAAAAPPPGASPPEAAASARAAAAMVLVPSDGSVGAEYDTSETASWAGCSATEIWACMT